MGISEATVQVPVVQAGSIPSTPRFCRPAVRLIGEAAAGGAKVIVFPAALARK